MRLRTFTAPDMNRAMLMIRETLGDDAVIISTTRDNESRNVSVTAAVDEEWEQAVSAMEEALMAEGYADEAEEAEEEEAFYQEEAESSWEQQMAAAYEQKRKAQVEEYLKKPPLMSHDAILKNRDLAWLLHELEKVFQFHSLPPALIEKTMRAAKHLDFNFSRTQEGVYKALVKLLGYLYTFEPLDLVQHPQRVMLIGPAGVGKTLTTAKIAAHLVADHLLVNVATIDNKRAGGVEQLRAFTAVMGIETEVADSRNELRSLLREKPKDEPLVIDSFATNPYAYEELKELTEFANLHEIEPILVLSAGIDAQEAADVAEAYAFLGIKRLLVTRVDTARRFGAILAAAEAADLSLCNFTNTPQVAGGFQPFDAEVLGDLFMQHMHEE